MRKVAGGVTTTCVLAVLGLPQVVVETTGGSSTAYLYGHDLLGEEGTAWAWHLNDGLGSVRQLTDSDGDVTLAQAYTPFGSLLWREGDIASGYGFTGEQEDAAVGLVFLRARYHDPAMGRFISPDTMVSEPAFPADFNRYIYVRNNPPNLIDPSGHTITHTTWINPIAFEPYRLGSTGVKVLDVIGQAAINIGCGLLLGVCKVEDGWLKPTSDVEFTFNRLQAGLFAFLTPLSMQGCPYSGSSNPGGMPDASLGLSDYVFEFQYEVVPEAKTFTFWEEAGLSGPTFPNFPEAFESAMNNAPRIHFNLTGIRNVREALELGRTLGWGSGNMTNTELYLVVNNPKWFAKTTFYLNGAPLSLTEVLKLLGGQ